MLACDERRARDTHADIETQRIALKECSFLDSAAAEDSARFLRTLQAQPGLVQGLAVGPVLRLTHASHPRLSEAQLRACRACCGTR
jgi:hypothetical protein